MQARATTGGSKTLTWDVLFYNVTYTQNSAPVITNVTASATTIKGGNTLTIYANTTSHGVNDSDAGTVNLYCSSTNPPTSGNTECTGGTTSDSSYPYVLTCTFATPQDSTSHIEYCRVYDGTSYSSTTANVTYTTDSTAPTTTIASVAGDTSASYFDTSNDNLTLISINGESGMSCRWSSSDITYSGMSNSCSTTGTQSNCSVNDATTQALTTRYVACQDSLTNEQNASNNLNVQFYLDYTPPTTTSNAVTDIEAPNYTITITEADNVDSDPTSFYCTSTTQGCTPSTSIDTGGVITYTNSNRGTNYLRFYSTDDAGNTQTIVNQTININQIPILLSATDNAVTIRGETTVNISTSSNDPDTSQTLTLYICNSSSATISGCTSGEYCTTSGTTNLTCGFTSETDSTTHSWYAFLFDDVGEAASNNSLSGAYITDSTAPNITIVDPANTTFTDQNLTINAALSEAGNAVWYQLDGNITNVSMSSITSTAWTATLTDLSVGSHNITVYANDSYDNRKNSSIRYFTISTPPDTAAPAITMIAPTNGSYNNAIGIIINISTSENLSWAAYQFSGSTLVNLTQRNATNWYSITNITEETTYNLTIYANDSSGNQGNKTIQVYADSLPPRYTNAQATPSTINVSQTINCSITWNDTYQLQNIKISENVLGTPENHSISFSGTTGSVSYLISAAKTTTIGTYTCVFYAEDSSGNKNITNTTFTIADTTPPTLSIISPTNTTYNQNNITISLSTSEAVRSSWYSLDGAANITLGNTSTTSWNGTLTGISDNPHNIQFYANDSSGNIGNSSIVYFTVNTVAPDTTPPFISITTLNNNTYYTTTTLVLNISASETLTWAGYKLNGGSTTNMTNSSTTDWTTTLTGLETESTNVIQVFGNDSNSNTGNNTLTIYVDTTPPRFSNVNATPSTANESQSVICNAYVNDTFALSNVKIEHNSTGTFQNNSVDIIAAGNMNHTISSLNKGQYLCRFYATDAAGNTNSTSTIFTVNDVISPIITINSPLTQNYSSNTILLSISLNETGTYANYSLDGGATNATLTGSGTSWSRSISITPDGAYNVTFYTSDASGNTAFNSRLFTIDTSVTDTTGPIITILNPSNNTYSSTASTILNITANEALAWAGYTDNEGTLTTLDNISTTNWNTTIILTEGAHTIIFYANDTSSNNNQGNKTTLFYVDTSNPFFTNFTCTSPRNESLDVICSGNVNDTVQLATGIISYNATGIVQNSSNITLSGTNDLVEYTINEENTSIGLFGVTLYLYDMAGRTNSSTILVNITDDTTPLITNISYIPNDTISLDPGVMINVSADLIENYRIGSVWLMYQNTSSGTWTLSEMSNTTSSHYTGNFTPGNGTWVFRINATDAAGNMNISNNETLIVSQDTSFYNSTTITTITSVTYAQLSDTTTLGLLYVNNTGDTPLTFNITIDSSISSRFNIAGLNLSSTTYQRNSTQDINITIYTNTTDLPAGAYPYNITLSSTAGTTIYEKILNIQTAAGPYLDVEIQNYSSSVTLGQTGITLQAAVTNLGTADATGVILNWTTPTGIIITSGNASRDIGALPLGTAGTNTLTISVDDTISDSELTIFAIAISTNADSANDSRTITITDPITVSINQSQGGSSGGGGGGGSGMSGGGIGTDSTLEYSKIKNIVRGEEDSFTIDIENNHTTATLEDITITLTGFPEKYFTITPKTISKINPKKTESFTVDINIPDYSGYQEFSLKATIEGKLNDGTRKSSYKEIQNIKLIIQEVSKEETTQDISRAEQALAAMNEKGFNSAKLEQLYKEAQGKLQENKYKEAQDLANEIVTIQETAIRTEIKIARTIEAISNPRRSALLTTNINSEFTRTITKEGIVTPQETTPGITGFAIKENIRDQIKFASNDVKTLVDLALIAFDRGDYTLAESRIDSAIQLLIIERRGDPILFFYLYWPFIIGGLIVAIVIIVLGLKILRKNRIRYRIKTINKEETTLQELAIKNQREYYSGKISKEHYEKSITAHQEELLKIQKERTTLRNKRIHILKPEEELQELAKETKEVEDSLKKVQEEYFVNKKIGKEEYDLHYEYLQKRLAEIEDERSTLILGKKHRK